MSSLVKGGKYRIVTVLYGREMYVTSRLTSFVEDKNTSDQHIYSVLVSNINLFVSFID